MGRCRKTVIFERRSIQGKGTDFKHKHLCVTDLTSNILAISSLQGELVAIKQLRKDSINLTRDILIEMKQVRKQKTLEIKLNASKLAISGRVIKYMH